MTSCYCMNPVSAFLDGLCAVHVANAGMAARGELGFAVERGSGETELVLALGSLQEGANVKRWEQTPEGDDCCDSWKLNLQNA